MVDTPRRELSRRCGIALVWFLASVLFAVEIPDIGTVPMFPLTWVPSIWDQIRYGVEDPVGSGIFWPNRIRKIELDTALDPDPKPDPTFSIFCILVLN